MWKVLRVLYDTIISLPHSGKMKPPISTEERWKYLL